MFAKYFEDVQEKILKSAQGRKTEDDKGAKKGKKNSVPNIDELKNFINGILPLYLKAESKKIIDPSGYSPDGIDLAVYKEVFRNINDIMDEFIPADIVYGTFQVCSELRPDNLIDILSNIVSAKKLNRFSESVSEATMIPSFIIAYGTKFKLPQLKEEILNFYISKSIEQILEFDIIVILKYGIIVKDWREKRNFIALETGKDTLKWFFILMNEYMDMERGDNLDLRNYVRNAERYNEY